MTDPKDWPSKEQVEDFKRLWLEDRLDKQAMESFWIHLCDMGIYAIEAMEMEDQCLKQF